MKKNCLCILIMVAAFQANAQKLIFDTFQPGKISLEALFDSSKENLGQKESLDCYIEITIDEKKKLRLEGRKQNGELLFSFGKGNSQMFACDTSDLEGRYFQIQFFDAEQALKDPENAEELAYFEIFNEENRIDVFIGSMFGENDRELLRFTLSDKPSNSKIATDNRIAINNLKKRLKEILPN